MIRKTGLLRDRRKGKDLLAHLFVTINFIAWGVLFAALLVFHRAQPEFESFFDRFYPLAIRTHWDRQFLDYLAYTIFIGFSVSMAGLVLSFYRARRRTDWKIQILVLGVMYLVLLAVCFLFI